MNKEINLEYCLKAEDASTTHKRIQGLIELGVGIKRIEEPPSSTSPNYVATLCIQAFPDGGYEYVSKSKNDKLTPFPKAFDIQPDDNERFWHQDHYIVDPRGNWHKFNLPSIEKYL